MLTSFFQKQKAQQEQWAAMVQTEIQMDTKEAETPVLDNDSSPGENEEEERVEETTLPEEPVVTLTQESRLRVVDSFSAILEGPPGDHTALEETVRTMIDRFYKGAVSKEYAYLTVLDYVRSLYPRHPLSEEEIDAITAEAMGYMNNLAANAAARSLPGYSNIPALPDPVIDLFNESVFRVKDAYHILKPKKLVLPGISKPLVFAAAFIAATFAGAGTAGQTRGMQRIPGAIPFSQLEQEARNTPADMSNPPPQAPTGYAGRAVPADAPPPQTP